MLSKPGTPEERFDQLYRKTSDDVLAYLIRRSRSSEDAADALAETYAAAWRKLNSLPAGDHTRLWLFGAARNELRKTASRLQADDDLNATLTNEAGPLWEPEPNADDGDDALRDALASLSRLDQEIVTLTAWEELAPREIAVVLGLSANVVRIRLHRARSHLRAALKPNQCLEAESARAAQRSVG